jgi:hypothetical protein
MCDFADEKMVNRWIVIRTSAHLHIRTLTFFLSLTGKNQKSANRANGGGFLLNFANLYCEKCY